MKRSGVHTIENVNFGMFKRPRTIKGDFETDWCVLKFRTYKSVACNDLDRNYIQYKSQVHCIINEFKKELFLNKVIEEYTDYALSRALDDSSTLAKLKGGQKVVIDNAPNRDATLRNLRCCHRFNNGVCAQCKMTPEEAEASFVSLKECLYVTKDLRTLDSYKRLEAEMEHNAIRIQEDCKKIKLSQEDESIAQKYTDDIRAYMRHFKNRTLLEYLCNRECRSFLMIHYRAELDYIMRVYQFLSSINGANRLRVYNNPQPEEADADKAKRNKPNKMDHRIRQSYKHMIYYSKKNNKSCLHRLLLSCKREEVKGLLDFLHDTKPMNSLYMHTQIWSSFMNGLNITKNEKTFKEYMKAYMHRRSLVKNIYQTLTDMNMVPAKSGFVYDLMLDNRGYSSVKICIKRGVHMLSVNGSYYREFRDLYNTDVDELEGVHVERTPIMMNKYGPVITTGGSRALKSYNVARSYKSLFAQNTTGNFYKKTIDYYVPASEV
ncbi:Orf96 [Heliothis zea nudivirus]|uniref:Orf96 n=1 Tax=Heliothis zea nudivirus 1 TaxID=3116536 RepID=Q8JKL7_9VIRU|nr:Orf96 [Heliothis zea nudivirus]AAN04390.1 Orf96 [Heliothis zea nudivirus]